jgi:hypothetical protein
MKSTEFWRGKTEIVQFVFKKMQQVYLLTKCMKYTNFVVAVPVSYTGLFISPSRNSELRCATTKTDTAERSI